jgi:hypothetical protein
MHGKASKHGRHSGHGRTVGSLREGALIGGYLGIWESAEWRRSSVLGRRGWRRSRGWGCSEEENHCKAISSIRL